MKGTVKIINTITNRTAVETDYGYTVFDIEHGSVQLNDILSGDLDSHGSQRLRNHTSDDDLEVYVEAVQATQQSAKQLLIQY